MVSLTRAIWSAICSRPSSSLLIWAACSSGLSNWAQTRQKCLHTTCLVMMHPYIRTMTSAALGMVESVPVALQPSLHSGGFRGYRDPHKHVAVVVVFTTGWSSRLPCDHLSREPRGRSVVVWCHVPCCQAEVKAEEAAS